MSPNSHAVNLLRSLYTHVLMRQRRKQWADRMGLEVHRRCAATLLEALEPRVMLSSTPALLGFENVLFNGTDGADALYLRIADQTLEFSHTGAEGSYASDIDAAPGLQTLVISPDLNIFVDLGGGDDSLYIDSSLNDSVVALGSSLVFHGGAGSDALFGPGGDSTWNITGADSGTLNAQITFDGVENLIGAADNDDTFILAEGGSLAGHVEGGERGFDSLEILDGSYETLVFRPTGPHSGFVELDGVLFAYEGLEPVASKIVGAVNVTIVGHATNDSFVLEPTGGMLKLWDPLNAGIETHTFAVPTGSLSIDMGDGDDSLTIKGTLALGGADLSITAETITLDATTNLTTTGDVTLTSDAVLDISAFSVGDIATQLTGMTVKDLEHLISDFILGSADAQIHLDGATVSANNITMSASSTVTGLTTGLLRSDVTFDIQGFSLALANINALAEVIVTGGSITATGDLELTAVTFVETTSKTESQSSDNDDSYDASFALSVVDSDAVARITGSATLSVNGNVDLTAINTTKVTTTADGEAGGGTAAGGSIAMAFVDATTQAVIDGTVSTTGMSSDRIELVSRSTTDVKTDAVSTAKGSTQNSTDTQGKLAETDAKSDESEGGVGLAGAFALSDVNVTTQAYILSGSAISSGGTVQAFAYNDTDSSAVADGSQTGSGATGVGVAIAVNLPTVLNEAYIGGSLVGVGMTISALKNTDRTGDGATGDDPDGINKFEATATSGAAGTTVGAAGSFAMNLLDSRTRAKIVDGGTVNPGGGNVLISSTNDSDTKAKAISKADGGSDIGVGASVALNIADASVTLSELSNGAVLSGADDLTLTATSDHKMDTTTEAGSSGGTSVTPSLPITYSDNDTTVRLGTGSQLVLLGSLNATATHTGSATSTGDAEAAGSNVAVGATVAITIADDTVIATTNRDIDAGGAVTFAARGGVTTGAEAKASTQGADANNSGGDTSANEQVEGKMQYADTKSTSNKDGSQGSAETSDGAVSVAAAIAVNVTDSETNASIPSGRTVVSGGLLTVSAENNTDAKATGNGNAVDGSNSVAVGAGVAVNVPTVTNKATVAGTVTAEGLTVEAKMRDTADTVDTHTFEATGTSGAGASDVGVAGALGLNIVDSDTEATIASGADVTITGAGNLTLTARNTTDAKAKGTSKQTSSPSVGVGASVALNVASDTVTRAEIADTAKVTGSNNVNLTATADHKYDATVEAGAAGDVAISPAVAVNVVDNDTIARIGAPDAGDTTLDAAGDVTVHADHTDTVTANADGTAAGISVGIGAAVAVTVADDTSKATISRDVSATGAVAVTAESDITSTIETKAAAKGNESSSNGGKDADTEANEKVKNNSNTGYSSDLPSANAETTSANSTSNSNSSTSSDGVGVAAAIAVNIVTADNIASIDNNADVTAGGELSVSAKAEIDVTSKAVGTAVDLGGSSNNIGAAVGLNVVTVNNKAFVVSGSDIEGDGITIEAVTTDAEKNDIIVWAAAAAGGQGDVGVAGSVGVNVVTFTTEASGRAGSSLLSNGNLTVTGENDLAVQTLAAGGGFSTETAVGAAVAVGVVNSTTSAFVAGAADAAGAMLISAETDVTPLKADLPILGDSDDPVVTSLAVAGGASSGDVGVAGAVVVNVFGLNTYAYIAGNAQVNQDPGVVPSGQSVTVLSVSNTQLTTMAGSLGASAGSVGVGAGLDLGVITKDTKAYIGLGADVDSDGAVVIDADSSETIISIAANAGVGNSVGVAGSAAVQIITTGTRAYIADTPTGTPATIHAGGDVTISADGDLTAKLIAGSIGVGSSAGIGAANTTLIHTDTVEAYVGARGIVTSAGVIGLSITADSTEDIITIGAAGGGASTVGIAGTAVVNVLDETTTAYIGRGADITADNAGAAGEPGIILNAGDRTTIISVAGSLAAGGTAGVGFGADVGVIDKNTRAYIDSNVTATTEGDIILAADSTEDITSVAAGVSVSGTVSVALDASVHTLNIKTRAFIGDDPTDSIASAGAGNVHANGNVVIASDDQTEIDKVVGVLAVSGTAGIGAAAGVTVIDKTTESFIGAGAKVTGDGNTAGVTVRTGAFTPGVTAAPGFDPNNASGEGIESSGGVESSDSATLAADGEVNVPNLDMMDADQDGGNDLGDGSFTGQRTLTPGEKAGFHGVALTATNRDDIEAFTISLAGGTVGVAISAGVNVVETYTRAYVGSGALVNDNLSGAGSAQSVHLAAGNDFYHLAVAGSIAGGVVGVGPAVGVTVLSNTTEAYIANATVKAKDDVTVEAHAREDILLIGFGIGGGVVGIGGAVSVLTIDNTTTASVGGTVSAGGDVLVLATDDTDIDMISGALAGGLVGIGASVGVMVINKDTQAFIDTGATVDAKGAGAGLSGVLSGTISGGSFDETTVHGLVVQAQSSEDIFHMAVAAGAGFVGVSGAVAVTLLDSDTEAYIGAGAQINQTGNNTGADADQSVYVCASNDVSIMSFAGALAGGAVGVAGAVDVGSVKNDTSAKIYSGAHVKAKKDVEVNALDLQELEGFTFSGAAGVVGLAASVSVWSVGTQIDKTYEDDQGSPGNAVEGEGGAMADEDAAAQGAGSHGEVSSQLAAYGDGNTGDGNDSSTERVGAASGAAGSRIGASAPNQTSIQNSIDSTAPTYGTEASIESGAVVTAGRDINVTANGETEVDMFVGTVAGGLVGVGASVAVTNIDANKRAHADGILSAGRDITVRASLKEDVDVRSFAGAGGFVGVGAAVAVVDDTSVVEAYIGGGADILSADDLTVTATTNQTFYGFSGAVSGGAVAIGASFAYFTVGGTVQAYIGAGVDVGQGSGTVKDVTITANSTVNLHTEAFGLSAGIGAGSANFAYATIEPDVKAAIGANAKVKVTGDVELSANLTATGYAEVIGAAAGGLAIGASIADVTLGRGNGTDEVVASLGDGVQVQAQALRITTTSTNDLLAESFAGVGGVIGIAGAISNVTNDNAAVASIGDNADITVLTLLLSSTQDQDVDSMADNFSLGIATGTGAGVDNTITSKANVVIGSGNVITADNIILSGVNRLTKDDYANSTNLYSFSGSLGNISVLKSDTQIGTVANPFEARVIIGNSDLTAEGTNSSPAIFQVETSVDIYAVDKVEIESFSGFGVSVGISEIETNSLTGVTLTGSTLVNKTGDIYLTGRTDTDANPSVNLLVVTALTGGAGAKAYGTVNARNEIHLDSAVVKGSDIYLFVGKNAFGVPNLLDSFADAQIAAFSLLPNISVPIARVIINETNWIDVQGTSKVQALEDVNLIAREGLGGNDRGCENGMVLSLSLIPYGVDVDDNPQVTSNNIVSIGGSALVEAGINNKSLLHIKPLKIDGVYQLAPARLGTELTAGEKTALGLDADLKYEYAALDASGISFSISQGTVIQVVSGYNDGGTVGHYYSYKPQTGNNSHNIVLEEENYAGASRWTHLGGSLTQEQQDELTVYTSDATATFSAALNGKFYVIKPVELEMPTLSYVNIGNLLFEQRQMILDWLANHSTDAEAVARYQVRLQVIDDILDELGLMETGVNEVTGEVVVIVKKELDMLFVDLPAVYAAPGSIFIDTSAPASAYTSMLGSRLIARAGAEIDIFNMSPFNLTVNDTIVRDNKRVTTVGGELIVLEPGNVYVNNISLTGVGPSTAPKRIDIMQDSLPGSSYDLGGLILPNLDQDMYIVGDVINEAGNIYITNMEGSINVSGIIRGEEVFIIAARDFNLNTDDWFHTNRDPRQYINYDALRAALWNEPGTPGVLPFADYTGLISGLDEAINISESRILAQGRIAITARYLNINGLIQSGVETITLNIAATFVAPNATTSFVDDDGDLLPGISFGPYDVPVDGYFDAQKQAIVVEEIVPKGGTIIIAGQILSTGNGQLRVANGYTSVDIDNDSPYDLVIDRIDTTTNRQGSVTVVDTVRLLKVEYKVDAGGVVETTSTGVLNPGDIIGDGIDNDGDGDIDDGQIPTIEYTVTGTAPHDLTDDIWFHPEAGLYYLWTEGQEFTQTTVYKYEKKSFNLFGDNWLADWLVGDTSYVWKTIEFTDKQPLLESELVVNQGTLELPSYADGTVYAIGYERQVDTDVELVPGVTQVRYLSNGIVYRYKAAAPAAEVILSNVEYPTDANWEEVDPQPGSWTEDPANNKFDSDYINTDITTKKWTTGGGWLRKKTVHTKITWIEGMKDYYTHALKADYPILIDFLAGSGIPQISVETKGDLYLQGNISSPGDAGGTVKLLSENGSVMSADTVAIFGAAELDIDAGQDVWVIIEGDQGPVNVEAGEDITINVVFQGSGKSILQADDILATGSDVVINSPDGIVAYAGGSSIEGDRVELNAKDGTIGSAVKPVRVDSNQDGTGGLAAKANGNIYIIETSGDMKLIQPEAWHDIEASIYSATGSVYLETLSGSILDAHYEQFRPGLIMAFHPISTGLQALVTAGLVSVESLQNPLAPGLMLYLYPHTEFLGEMPDSFPSETPNIDAAGTITLKTGGGASSVGQVTDAIVIDLTGGYDALPLTEKETLGIATAEDITGVSYALYEYLGSSVSGVDLTHVAVEPSVALVKWLNDDVVYRYTGAAADRIFLPTVEYDTDPDWTATVIDPDTFVQDVANDKFLSNYQNQETFDDAVMWSKIDTDFVTGAERTGSQVEALAGGKIVLVQYTADEYGLYEYVGPSGNIDLTQEDFGVVSRWQKVTVHHSTSDGSIDLDNGDLILNKFVVEHLAVQVWDDVDLEAAGLVTIDTADGVAIQTTGALKINHINAGGHVRLTADGAITDQYTDTYAAISAFGDLVMRSGAWIRGASSPLRTRLATTSKLSAEVAGELDLLQVSDDVTIAGQFKAISDLYVYRVSAGGFVNIEVEQGDMYVGKVASATSVDLTADDDIFDAFDDSGATVINIFTGAVTSPATGNVNLDAGGDIGEYDNFLDVEIWVGELNSLSGNDTFVHSRGSLNVGTVTSTSGDVVLDVDGDANVDIITALAGKVAVTADGAIVDRREDDASNIDAMSVVLNAESGTIGTSNPNPFDINSSNAANGTVTAEAHDEIFLIETAGAMRVNTIVSETDDVTLIADGSILDANAAFDPNIAGLTLAQLGIAGPTPADLNVAGVNINLTSLHGSVGLSSDALEINSSSPTTGWVNTTGDDDVYLTEVIGEMNVGEVTSAHGDVGLNVRDSAATGEDLLMDADARISAPEGSVFLNAGDDAIFDAGSEITSAVEIVLHGDTGDTGNNDVGGTLIDISGSLDTVSIEIAGERESDEIILHPVALSGHTRVLGDTDGLPGGEDRITLDKLPTITTTHDRPGDGLGREVRDTVDLDGRGGTDTYVVNITAGRTDYLVNVQDTGDPNDGADTLTINGTDTDDADDETVEDLFLLRKHFVAYLTPNTSLDDLFPEVERINYDQTINGRLRVNAGQGNDQFYVDDNSAITTLDGGEGKDLFQIGQVFGTNPNGWVYADTTEDPRVVADDVDGIDLTSDSDDIELLHITRGWLSNGITFPMVIFGGEGGDMFSVYSNKAVLRMEGESGNDTFLIRAFVAEEEVFADGGADDDHFEYNINAPVSINGGPGFDTVVAIGSELADAFIITRDGIFGAGLNINVDGVEEAIEVDGLEGDDQFFILSTREGVVTTVIGGLGSDTFNVTGDVTADIISQTLEGRTGVINHGSSSTTDVDYDKLLVEGIALVIADETQGKVVITESGAGTEVIEDSGGTDYYDVSFSILAADIDISTIVYITVSAVMSSSSDRRLAMRNLGPGDPDPAESVLVSTDSGVTWLPAAVLTFNKVNWDTPQRVWVMAAHDDAIEGERKVMISHSLIVESDSAADRETFHPESVPIPNVAVRVLDDDLGSLLIVETGADTRVLEGGDVLDGAIVIGNSAISDTYNAKLSVAPTHNVTVALNHDTQIELFDEFDVKVTELTFTPANWDTWRTLTVRAVDDLIRENRMVSTVEHVLSSVDPIYSAAPTAELSVHVVDNDAPNVLVTESDGFTRLVKGVKGDDYTLRPVSQPVGEVTINIFTDGQTYIKTNPRVFLNNVGDALPVTVTFADNGAEADTITRTDGGNWLEDRFVIGSLIEIAGDANPGNNMVFKINDLDETVMTLTMAANLTDSVASSVTIQRKADAVTFNETNWFQDVTLEVEVDEDFIPDPSKLFVRQEPLRPHTVDQISGPLIIEGNIGEGKDRSIRSAVMLPTEETAEPIAIELDIDETQHADRLNVFNDSSVSDDRGLMTSTHLRNQIVLLGDVANGIDPINLSGLGMSDDVTFDISEAQDGSELVTIPGGITFDDIEVTELLLGRGNDRLDIEATSVGTFGADGFVVTVVHGGGNTMMTASGTMDFDGDTITRTDALAWDAAGYKVGQHVRVTGDTVNEGLYEIAAIDGTDLVLADAALTTESAVADVTVFGDSIVVTGGGGPDSPLAIFGDTTQDGIRYETDPGLGLFTGKGTLYPHAGNDVIDASASTQGVTIYGGAGNDVIYGSQAGDHIAGGSGDDEIHAQGGVDHVYGDSGFNLDYDVTVDEEDVHDVARELTVPTVNESYIPVRDDLVAGRDTIHGDGENDLIFGDHGVITQSEGTLRILTTDNVIEVRTDQPNNGLADTIFGDAGNDLIFGGGDGDTIHGNEGNDLIFGDHGRAHGTVDGDLLPLATLTPEFDFHAIDISNGDNGGSDTIYGDAGEDIILGGQGSDAIWGGDDDDDIIGGHNVPGGHDAGDWLDGGAGDDVIAGDNAVIERRGDAVSPRMRALEGTVIYGEDPAINDGLPLVTGDPQTNPDDTAARTIQMLDHSDAPLPDTSGDDTVAGGADDDVIFGQLGDDTLHGDGRITGALVLETLTDAPEGSDAGGDDYVEGNGGNDTIYGGLGQDDLIGGSSDFYGLDTPSQRPDGSDTIYGGNGDAIARNDLGDTSSEGHARDADVILGDNGRIYRLVGINGADDGAYLTFNYDNYNTMRIVVRATDLLDYTLGGPDLDAAGAATDIGAGDRINGEAGDDSIYGMVGDDVLYGDAQDDDIIGGWGNDWISGGTGIDGVLGDDGRIYTSRNTERTNPNDTALSEPLYGIDKLDETDQRIDTPGNIQVAYIHPAGELKKTVNLAPFHLDPNTSMPDPLFDANHADDIIYGGWGNDFLHGGAGDDAISGAEALPTAAAIRFPTTGGPDPNRTDGVIVDLGYDNPSNPGNILGFEAFRGSEFAAYDEYHPLRKIIVDGQEFFMNFDASEGPLDNRFEEPGTPSDGDDVIFGDLGNDWIVGGTGKDHLYGGRGDDLMNADDDHDTTLDPGDPMSEASLANDSPDTDATYEDTAYGGAGRDVLIANTGGDRLIDWVGEFNSYLVPYAPFGMFTVSRTLQPQLKEYLYDLSAADGADPTRFADTGTGVDRNGEPDGEIGLVAQKDPDWHDQTGAPNDPQAGNIPGGKRDVLRGASFNDGTAEGFAADSGTWSVTGGRLEVAPEALGGDAVSVFYVNDYLPNYFEIMATINADKDKAGYKSNAYLIFDYQNEYDFKFAGVNPAIDKLQMGHRTTEGWIVDVQSNMRLWANTDYNLLLAVNGVTATLMVDNTEILSYAFSSRADADGFTYGLNAGMVGIGANNSRGRIDNVSVQVLPPEITFEATEDFSDGYVDLPFDPQSGLWQVSEQQYMGTGSGDTPAVSLIDLGMDSGLSSSSVLNLQAVINTDGAGGLVFDYYGPDDFKFVEIDAEAGQIIIGHYTLHGGWSRDAVIDVDILPGVDYTLGVSLKGSTVSVTLDDQAVLGYVYNSVTVDGGFGLLSYEGSTSFDSVTVETDDPVLEGVVVGYLM